MTFLTLLWGFRKQIFKGAIVLALVWFAGSWHLRGVKVEELEIKLETAKMKSANDQHKVVRAWFADREACAKIADAATAQQKAHEAWAAEQTRLHEKTLWEMAAVELQAHRESLAAEDAQAAAVESVNQTDVLAKKVEELARAIQGWQP